MKLEQTSQWNVLSRKIKPVARPLISEVSESHAECFTWICSYLDCSNWRHRTHRDSGYSSKTRDDTSSELTVCGGSLTRSFEPTCRMIISGAISFTTLRSYSWNVAIVLPPIPWKITSAFLFKQTTETFVVPPFLHKPLKSVYKGVPNNRYPLFSHEKTA